MKGDERKEPFPFYLAEYVWNSNSWQLRPEQQIAKFLKIIFSSPNQKTFTKEEKEA